MGPQAALARAVRVGASLPARQWPSVRPSRTRRSASPVGISPGPHWPGTACRCDGNAMYNADHTVTVSYCVGRGSEDERRADSACYDPNPGAERECKCELPPLRKLTWHYH